MADDRRYEHGAFYRVDDRSGFKVRAKETKKEWNGLIVRKSISEPRHPQDFVKGRRDDQTVREARSRSIDVFIGPISTLLTLAAAPGDTVITVEHTTGMANGNDVGVMLDDGTVHRTTINGTPTATTVTLTVAVTLPAAIDNIFIRYGT